MSVYVIFLSLEPGFLSYDFGMETHRPGNVRGLTPKSEKRGKFRRQEKHDRGNTL